MKWRNGPQSVDFSSLFFWLTGKAIVHGGDHWKIQNIHVKYSGQEGRTCASMSQIKNRIW
jgi:hypothetical protein